MRVSLLVTRKRFLLLAGLCISLCALAAAFLVRSLFLPDAGLLGSYPEAIVQGGRLVFSPSKPFSAAMRAGLVPDEDVLVSVNGRPVSTSRDLVQAVATIRGFGPFPVEVQRPSGSVETIIVTPFFRPARLEWICILAFCLSLAVMACAVSWRLPLEGYSLPIVLSALLSALFSCVMPFAYESTLVNLLYNLGNVSSWLLVLFALQFPRDHGSRALRSGAVAAVILVYACFCLARVWLYAAWMSSGAEDAFTVYKRIGQAGNISDGIAYVVLTIQLWSAHHRASSARERSMLAWLLAGVLMALPPYFFLDQLPEILGGAARGVGLGSLSQLFLAILPVFFLVGLTRRGFLDLRSFLVRYATYGSLVLVATGLFAVAYIPLSRFARESYRLDSPLPELLSAGTIMILVALLRVPLERLYGRRRHRQDRHAEAPLDVPEYSEQQIGRVGVNARLAETRALFLGVARALKEPLRDLRAGSAANSRDAVDRISAFLHDLEDRAGPTSLIPGSATPREIVMNALDRVRPHFPEIRFEVEGDPGQRIACFPEELAQAAEALLHNAAEAAAAADRRVVVRVAGESGRAVIEVCDTGAGMDARARRRLFQPFVGAKPGHLGLGLYVSRILAERNGGSVEIEAEIGTGTVARLAFGSERGMRSGKAEDH